jgi:UDPglucose 6-dehydrogenase
MKKEIKIGIIGIGMVGSPFKRYFEEKGFKRGKNLFCYDVDPKKGFFDDVSKANIIFISVPTPRNSDGSCNVSIVEDTVKKFHNKKKVLVIKSTIEPGVVARLQKKYKCPILFNPEFLTESRAWEDFIRPDRQVVGHTAKSKIHAGNVLNLLPEAFFSSPGSLGTYDFVRLNSSEAEMGKYAGNVFGAMKVVFGNILADFCAALEKVLRKEGIRERVHYENVRKMLAHDRRIGDAWLNVKHGEYRGFGGYCFPKDTDAFIVFAKKLEKKLSVKNKEERSLKKLVRQGINFLESMRDYNVELLKSQGLTVEDVSSHNSELNEKLKKLKRKKAL